MKVREVLQHLIEFDMEDEVYLFVEGGGDQYIEEISPFVDFQNNRSGVHIVGVKEQPEEIETDMEDYRKAVLVVKEFREGHKKPFFCL